MKEFALFILVAMVVFCVVMLFKNTRTCVTHCVIANAICAYKIQCVYDEVKPEVDYSDMCSYEATLFRLFDWGHEHILPPDKYIIIEPYIGKKVGC